MSILNPDQPAPDLFSTDLTALDNLQLQMVFTHDVSIISMLMQEGQPTVPAIGIDFGIVPLPEMPEFQEDRDNYPFTIHQLVFEPAQIVKLIADLQQVLAVEVGL
jgi:hypothetical protein